MIDTEWALQRTNILIRMKIGIGMTSSSHHNSLEVAVLCRHNDDDGPLVGLFTYSSYAGTRARRELWTATDEHEWPVIIDCFARWPVRTPDKKDVAAIAQAVPRGGALNLPQDHFLVAQKCAFLEGVIEEFHETEESTDHRAMLRTMQSRLRGLVRNNSDKLMWEFALPIPR
jgi:hypothetical protein